MITELKKMIKSEQDAEILQEALANNGVSSSIKAAFLDDIGTEVIGAENDPEIDKLIETIPEYEDGGEITEKDIEQLAESVEEEPSSEE